MTITFQFTLDDYRRAYQGHFKVGASLPVRLMMKGLIAGGSFFLLMGLMSILLGKSPLSSTWSFFLVGGIWLWLGAGGAYGRSAKAQFSKNPALRQERRVEISDEGIKTDAGVASSQLSWKAYLRYVETEDQFLLYTSPACFVIMPKRAFQPDQIEEFRHMLENHVGRDLPVPAIA